MEKRITIHDPRFRDGAAPMGQARDGDDAEAVELQLLLEGIHRRYGFDFRDYALASLRRRVGDCVRAEGLEGVSELQGRLLRDPACMERFLRAVTVNVTSMFRDPGFWRAVRAKFVPHLREQPFFRVWHVGC